MYCRPGNEPSENRRHLYYQLARQAGDVRTRHLTACLARSTGSLAAAVHLDRRQRRVGRRSISSPTARRSARSGSPSSPLRRSRHPGQLAAGDTTVAPAHPAPDPGRPAPQVLSLRPDGCAWVLAALTRSRICLSKPGRARSRAMSRSPLEPLIRTKSLQMRRSTRRSRGGTYCAQLSPPGCGQGSPRRASYPGWHPRSALLLHPISQVSTVMNVCQHAKVPRVAAGACRCGSFQGEPVRGRR